MRDILQLMCTVDPAGAARVAPAVGGAAVRCIDFPAPSAVVCRDGRRIQVGGPAPDLVAPAAAPAGGGGGGGAAAANIGTAAPPPPGATRPCQGLRPAQLLLRRRLGARRCRAPRRLREPAGLLSGVRDWGLPICLGRSLCGFQDTALSKIDC